MFDTDLDVFLGAPPGSRLTVCAEFAVLRMLKMMPHGRCIYVTPRKTAAKLVSHYNIVQGSHVQEKNIGIADLILSK